MAAEAAQEMEALEAQARRLMGTFTRDGYEQVAPSVIQPADLFLDVIGEELRARTYVFTDPDGEELCLRPDLTVPTCRLHLARHPGGGVPARYCYNGPAFRYQPGSADSAHPREFRQAGIESFAAPDRERDDAAVLALIIAALRETGLERFQLRIGDLSLFNALLDALSMPRRWRRRLRHHFWRPEAFRAELGRLTSRAALQPQGVSRDLVDRLDPHKPGDALALVAEHLDQAGLELIGTRTLEEIAERVLAEVADAREPPLEPQMAALIESYVAIKAPAGDAVRRIEDLLRPHKVDLGPALAAFRRRLDLIEAAGVATAEAAFSAEFGRSLEYYTGFVFEIVVPKLGPKSPIAGGGRYDSLLSDAGASDPVPAVGSSIHTERLLAALSGEAL
jgi:ATP phosphoribosyltransferase regulatory subunit